MCRVRQLYVDGDMRIAQDTNGGLFIYTRPLPPVPPPWAARRGGDRSWWLGCLQGRVVVSKCGFGVFGGIGVVGPIGEDLTGKFRFIQAHDQSMVYQSTNREMVKSYVSKVGFK